MEIVFEARVWLYQGAGAWHFVTLPKDASDRIHNAAAGRAKPGGSLAVRAETAGVRWKTSIFRDNARGAYLLPLKAAVRTKSQLREGDVAEFVLRLDVD